jgi:hypothetical protein
MRDKRHRWQDKVWGNWIELATKSVGTTAAQQVTWLLYFVQADGLPLEQATAEVCWFTWCAMTDSWDTDNVLLPKPAGWSLAVRPSLTVDDIDGFKRFVREGIAALLRYEDWWTRLPSRDCNAVSPQARLSAYTSVRTPAR